jgi:ABC-type uncharacterized transport system involved in gliding motility auxiliary subunit
MKQAIKFLLKYAVYFGVGLASAGLVAGLVTGSWDMVPTGLMIAGVVLMGIWVLFLGRFDAPGEQNFWQRRSTQVGTNAFISTLSVLAILGLLNFVAVRNVQKFDLTETQLFSLAPETLQVVKGLKEPVNLYIFSNDRNPADQELLAGLRAQNRNFNFEYVDAQTNPTLAQRFELKNDLVNKDVFVERFSKQQNRPINQFVQLINPQQRLSEARIVNALVRVNSDRRPKVYFLQGHGERSIEAGQQSIAQAVKTMTERNFEATALSLAQTGEVPIDAAIVAIVGPQKPLLEQEIKLLQDYQNRGGNLFILLDPKIQTGIDAWLQQWGVVLDERLAIDSSGLGKQFNLGPAAPVVNTYSNHPITNSFRNSYAVFPSARPLEIKQVAGVEANPIVLTNNRTWAELNPDEKPVKFGEGDRLGPLPLGVALSRLAAPAPAPSPSPSPTASPTASPSADPTASPTGSPSPMPSPTPSPTPTPTPSATPLLNPQSRMVVFGSASFAMDGYFSQVINSDVWLNSISWLSQDDTQPLSMRLRDVKNRRIVPTPGLVNGIFWGGVIVLPAIGLLAAFVLWLRRR